MQQLGGKTQVIEGVTVFSDHADPNQFWYLPSPVELAHRPDDSHPALTFIKYKPAAVKGGAKGGGFLMFETDLKLPADVERKIRSKLSAIAPGEVNLAAVPFDDGTVQCIALDLQGGGGTKAQPAAEPGTFRAVEEILGATVPSLSGDDTAAFSLTLSQEGATILDQALKQGTTPVGVIYDMKYSILHPALHVKIEADLKRVYDHFSASLEGKYYFFKAAIEAGFEKLRQDGAIKIEVIDFSDAQDEKEKEKWAFDFFKDNLMQDWFKPTLGPFHGVWDEGKSSNDNPLSTAADAAHAAANAVHDATHPSGDTSTSSHHPAGDTSADSGSHQATATHTDTSTSDTTATHGTTDAPSGTQHPSGSHHPSGTQHPSAGQHPSGGQAAPALQPAVWRVTGTTPDPLPADHRVHLTQADSGTSVTLEFLGGIAAPSSVKVNHQPHALSGRSLTLDVAAGASIDVEAEWEPVTPRVFQLFFDYDKPPQDPSTHQMTDATRQAYLAGTFNDQRFNQSGPPDGCGSGQGQAALRDWMHHCLRNGVGVDIAAHASYEGHDNKETYNLRLSERREEIAFAIAQAEGVSVATHHATGDAEAKAAGNVSSPDQPSPDRRVDVSEALDPRPQVRITGTVSRPASGGHGGGGGNGGNTSHTNGHNQPHQQNQPGHPANNGGGGIAGSPEIAFKLRYVHQDEQKHVSLVYDRTEAVKRTYAPQGFIGLLAEELKDTEKQFVEVDLDSPFFRQFTVDVEAPIDFERIGLASAHVSVDYGSPDDPKNHRHRDFVLDADAHARQSLTFFMNGPSDTDYTLDVQYHFSPDSGWDGEKDSYDFGPEKTEDRTLFINPSDKLSFHEVKVIPGDVDWGVVKELEAELTYESPSGWKTSRTFQLTQDATADQLWKVRTLKNEPFEYSAAIRARLDDGTERKTTSRGNDATIFAVNDPFEGALEVDFIPAFDPGSVQAAFIELEYDDPDDSYHRRLRLEMDGQDPQRKHARIALVNPDLRSYKYRLVFLGNDHHLTEGPRVETDDTFVAVDPAAAETSPTS